MKRKTIYLCGAGGKGNIGAEAIMLSIITIFREHYEDVQFIITAWEPDRVRELLAPLDGDFRISDLRRESLLANPVLAARSDIFVICGDISISESVVSFLPIYYALRTIVPRMLGKRVIFFGIEAEKINKWLNIFALKSLIKWTADYHVLRNRRSLDNLRQLSQREKSLLLGSEPSLILPSKYLKGFECHDHRISDSRPLIGFGVRDFFSTALRLNVGKMKLERRDVPTGVITDKMLRIIHFTADIADYLVDQYHAQPVFIPHHFLPRRDRVILPDSHIARMIIRKMKRPGKAVIIRDNLHPFEIINLYSRLDLVFSMRHHTNSFAFYNAVPTFGYKISEKIFNFFHEIGEDDMLIDPYKPVTNEIKSRIDNVLGEKEKISQRLKTKIVGIRKQMKLAFDIAVKGA